MRIYSYYTKTMGICQLIFQKNQQVMFYFRFSSIRMNTAAACALVVLAFGAKLPSVLPVIMDFSAAHITASFA